MNAIKVLIAAKQPYYIEYDLHLQCPDIYVQASITDICDAYEGVLRFKPDILIVEDCFIFADRLNIPQSLKRVLFTYFPYIIMLGRHDPDGLADAYITQTPDIPLLRQTCIDLVKTRLPKISTFTQTARTAAIHALLNEISFSFKRKGTTYIKEAVNLCTVSNFARNDFMAVVYPFIAHKYDTTCAAVEKSMRTAIEKAWLNGNMEAIERLFGISIDAERGKPTNAECITMLCEHTGRVLREKIRKSIQRRAEV